MKKASVVCLFVVAFSAAAGTVSAQVNAFMLVPGVKGGSMDAHHVDWIDVLSVQQELTPAKKNQRVRDPSRQAARRRGASPLARGCDRSDISRGPHRAHEVGRRSIHVL